MSDDKSNKINNPSNSSKELLYSEYTGTTAVERVLESLEKTANMTNSEKINMFLETKRKSESLERAKNLISLMKENQETSVLEASTDDKDAIDVVMEIDENTSNSNVGAWLFLNHSEDDMSECSDDVCGQDLSTQRKILYFENDSLESSDDECDKNISVSTEKKSFLNIVKDDSSDSSDDECQQNASVSIIENLPISENQSLDHVCKLKYSISPEKKNFSNFVENGSSNHSENEYEQNIVSTVRTDSNLFGKNSSGTSVVECKKSSVLETEKITVSEDVFTECSGNKNQQFLSTPSEKKRKLISVIEDEPSDIHDDENPQKISCFEKKIR